MSGFTLQAMNPSNEQTLDLGIGGMTCASCVARVEKALNRVPGVLSASVNLATERATVRFLSGATTFQDLAAAVEQAGYVLEAPEDAGPDASDREQAARDAEIRLAKLLSDQIKTRVAAILATQP